MKKRDIFLFLSFATLFVLFAIFQNFSFPTKQLQQITNKDFFPGKLHKFIPTYAFKNYIGNSEDIEAPYGYKEEINRRIASQDAPIIFDDRKFVKDELKALPVYKNIKDMIETSSSDNTAPCIDNPIEPLNNCFTEYNGEHSKSDSGSLKIKANPLRGTASISVPGDIESKMMYDGDRNSVNVQFKKSLNPDAGLKVELDSEQQSGSINIDVRW
ncbi:MAG: hypothetical protein V4596_04820 [Bdellovibrionota bacterium]